MSVVDEILDMHFAACYRLFGIANNTPERIIKLTLLIKGTEGLVLKPKGQGLFKVVIAEEGEGPLLTEEILFELIRGVVSIKNYRDDNTEINEAIVDKLSQLHKESVRLMESYSVQNDE